MEQILERHERYGYAEKLLVANDTTDAQVCHLFYSFHLTIFSHFAAI